MPSLEGGGRRYNRIMPRNDNLDSLTYEEILERISRILDELAQRRFTISASIGEGEPDLSEFTRMELGYLGERAFEHVAARNLVGTARPNMEGLPFDSVAIVRRKLYRLYKIQVRCTAYEENGIYNVSLRHSGGKKYQRGDFDFLAVLVVPESVWYIIPFNRVPLDRWDTKLYPRSEGKQKRGAFERYRNRWDLLR